MCAPIGEHLPGGYSRLSLQDADLMRYHPRPTEARGTMHPDNVVTRQATGSGAVRRYLPTYKGKTVCPW